MPAKSPAAPPAQTFETAMERLEGIVEAMESDKMPLEELIVRYEEGIKLVTICQEKLEAAEKRIEIITRGPAGKPQLAPFDPAAALAPEPQPIARAKSQDVSLF